MATNIRNTGAFFNSGRSLVKRILFAVISITLSISTALASASDEITPENFNLADYKGQVVYLDFWASWCGPCRATFPFMNELQASYGDSLKVIAVNLDQKRADADRFLKKYPASFSIIYDPQGVLATTYQPRGMPTSFFFDKQGKPAGQHVGFRKRDAELIRNALEKLLKQPSQPAAVDSTGS